MTLDDLPVVCALLLSSCGVVCVCVCWLHLQWVDDRSWLHSPLTYLLTSSWCCIHSHCNIYLHDSMCSCCFKC